MNKKKSVWIFPTLFSFLHPRHSEACLQAVGIRSFNNSILFISQGDDHTFSPTRKYAKSRRGASACPPDSPGGQKGKWHDKRQKSGFAGTSPFGIPGLCGGEMPLCSVIPRAIYCPRESVLPLKIPCKKDQKALTERSFYSINALCRQLLIIIVLLERGE